jgi:hypothetical protein
MSPSLVEMSFGMKYQTCRRRDRRRPRHAVFHTVRRQALATVALTGAGLRGGLPASGGLALRVVEIRRQDDSAVDGPKGFRPASSRRMNAEISGGNFSPRITRMTFLFDGSMRNEEFQFV